MAEAHITWIGKTRFVGTDSTNHSVVLSSGDDIGVKPSENLLIAIASCASVDVVEIVEKQRAELHQLTVHVTGEQQSDPPWKYTQVHLRFIAKVSNLTPERFERSVDLALNKYCSVRSSLDPAIPVTFEAVIEP
jgi:putative redox protein